jgi:iron complex outermembrane receptor protein
LLESTRQGFNEGRVWGDDMTTKQRIAAFGAASYGVLAATLASAQASPPGAAPSIAEVVVTARQRSETLRDAPEAVSVLTRATLEAAGVRRADDIVNLTPGVSIVNGSAEQGDTQVNIRGINSARDADPSFAFVVDGIQIANPSSFNREYVDVQQIEVVKGPQGAIYGRDAAAGAVIVTTRTPGDTVEGLLRATAGNVGSYSAQAYISGPLTDTLSGSLTADYRQTDGQYANSQFPSQRNLDAYRGGDVAGRLYFRFDPQTTLDLKGRYGQLDAGSIDFNAVFALPALAGVTGVPQFDENVNNHPFVFQNNVENDNRQKSLEFSAKLDHDFGWARLTGWGLFSKVDDDLIADGTSASFGFFNTEPHCIASTAALYAQGVTLPAPTSLGPTPAASFFGAYTPTTCDGYQYQRRNQTDESFELRLTSPSGGRLRWLGGVYYLHVDRNVGVATGIDDGGAPPRQLFVPNTQPYSTEQLLWDDFTTNVGAVFGQAQYDILKTVEGSFALRYDVEDRHDHNLVPTDARTLYIDYNGPPYTGGAPLNPGLDPTLNPGGIHDQDKTFSQLQPKASLRWKATPDLTVYGDWGVGFKSGGFNNEGSAATINTFINPVVTAAGFPAVNVQDIYAKEVSSEFEAGAKARLLDGRLNLDASVYHDNVHNMQFFEFFVGPFGLLRVVDNIDLVRLEGAELGADLKLTRYLSLDAAGSYIHSRIARNTVRPDTVGNESPYTPDYTINFALQYDPPLTATLTGHVRLDLRDTGPTWFHTVQNQSNPTVFELSYGPLGRANYGETQRAAFTTLNLRVGVSARNVTLTGFADNLTNTSYLAEVIPAPEFGGSFVSPGIGRRYGAELTYRF